MKFFRKNPRNSCPNNKIFINAFLNELSLKGKEKFLDHILCCQKCKMKFDVIKEVSNELKKRQKIFDKEILTTYEKKQLRKIARQRTRELKDEKKYIFNFIPAKYIALVSGLFIIIAGYMLISNLHKREIYRTEEKRELRLIEPKEKISKPPSVFSWSPAIGADHYNNFSLIDEDLNTLFKCEVRDKQSIILPENIRLRLKRGKTYIWRVETLDEYDNLLDSSSKHFIIE